MSTTTYTVVNGQVLRQNKDGVVSHFVSDPLGSVVMVRDNAGNTVYEAEYDPYGNVQSETGTNPSEFGYVGTLGYVKDSAFSLYVRARYLLTNLGRWLTKDPLWPDEAGFVYAGAVPTNWSDYLGLSAAYCRPNPLDFHGEYCGSRVGIVPNHSKPGEMGFRDSIFGSVDSCMNNWPAPRDCLDNACLSHDICLYMANNMIGYDARVCHCAAMDSAVDCLLTLSGPHPNTLITFIATFTLLCATTDLVGPGFIDNKGIAEACRRCRRQAAQACRKSTNPRICIERYRRMYCKRMISSC